MLRFHKLVYFDGKFSWEISSINGSLMKSEFSLTKNESHNEIVSDAIYFINNPYELKWSPNPNIVHLDSKANDKINFYNKILFRIGNKKFLLSILFSVCGGKYFETTLEAFSYISKLENFEYGSENCFQRCLLAAKLSKSFKKNGVIFIGAELSTFNMHAWIIENKTQPDLEDRVWINYRPLLAITF
jgi:hypothetical protein